MNVLEKILEEIEEKFKTADAEKCDCEELCDVEDWYDSGYIDGQLSAHEKCMDIIRSHMDGVPKCGECSRRKFYMQGYEDGKKDDGWIPVEERLPEEDERYKGRKAIDVLVTTANGRVTKVRRQSKYDYWCWGRIYGEPTAWQPLPKPYKEE